MRHTLVAISPPSQHQRLVVGPADASHPPARGKKKKSDGGGASGKPARPGQERELTLTCGVLADLRARLVRAQRMVAFAEAVLCSDDRTFQRYAARALDARVGRAQLSLLCEFSGCCHDLLLDARDAVVATRAALRGGPGADRLSAPLPVSQAVVDLWRTSAVRGEARSSALQEAVGPLLTDWTQSISACLNSLDAVADTGDYSSYTEYSEEDEEDDDDSVSMEDDDDEDEDRRDASGSTISSGSGGGSGGGSGSGSGSGGGSGGASPPLSTRRRR